MMHESTFASLGLAEALLSAVASEGYTTPTPIQTASIPPLLEGKDLLATAQTGTGKTAAFALPIIQLLAARPGRPGPRSARALVVAPTRELAAQIDASFETYGRGSRCTHACVFGGVGKSPQAKALGRGVDVLVATPGRLLDLHSDGSIRLDHVEIAVLDEADRMLDMGFIHDVRRVISLLPERRQTMLFSATMPKDIANLAATILKNPTRVAVSPEKPTVELIDQVVAYVEKSDKRAFLASLVASKEVDRAIVFTRTKHGADRLAKALNAGGTPAAAIHANKSQGARTRTMEDFRSGSIRILIATDLAARGIDVDGISHVFNYELPEVAETYIHRIGRTARAGASGRAVALCDSEEKPLLKAIEKLMRQNVATASGPEFDAAYEAAKAARALAPTATEIAERERDRMYESRGSFRGRGTGQGNRQRAKAVGGSPRSADSEYRSGTTEHRSGAAEHRSGAGAPAARRSAASAGRPSGARKPSGPGGPRPRTGLGGPPTSPRGPQGRSQPRP
jgi:ATP-dependent RNA helicase RhlE